VVEILGEAAEGTDPQRQSSVDRNDALQEGPVLLGAPVDEVPQGPLPQARTEIVLGGGPTIGEASENAKDEPASDALTILKILCVNDSIDSTLQTRESDAVLAYRARHEEKGLALKAARVEKQNELDDARTAKLRLEKQQLEQKIDLVREQARQACEAKKMGQPFNYERALNQISAVIGLRGPEMFRHEQRPRPLG
jgi:hypothetical protein